MRKLLVFIAIFFSVTQLWSQGNNESSTGSKPLEDRNFRIPLIGEIAPSFTTVTTNGLLSFPEDYGRKWKILFSHPQDFTPVCSSEILELANLQGEFDKLGVKLVVVSVDPVDSHRQWKKAMELLNYKDRKNVEINFPLVSDENLSISNKYGMIHPASNTTKFVRGVFIIDPDNIIQAIYFYPMHVGRNIDEILRTVEALQTVAVDKVMTPANWKPGDDLLVPFPPNTELIDPKNPPVGYYNTAWFMWFKEIN
jgi:peroxiredoxin (alkyl hydroperoxide reductase subunit C)